MNYCCSVCGGNKSEIIMKFDNADICKCKTCSHLFSANIKLKVEDIYSEEYFLENHKNFFKYPDIKLYEEIEKYIFLNKNKNISLLDIGCGTGNFLYFLKNKEYKNLYGVDFIKNSDDTINFVQSDIFEYSPSHKFDVIVSNMNIEHIDNLELYIKTIKNLLSKDGIIIINTINESSLLYSLSKILYKINIKFVAKRLYDPHHINHFNKKSLKDLFKRFNFISNKEIIKNYPLQAIDISNGWSYYIQKFGVIGIFLISSLSNSGVSQTQFFTEDII